MTHGTGQIAAKLEALHAASAAHRAQAHAAVEGARRQLLEEIAAREKTTPPATPNGSG